MTGKDLTNATYQITSGRAKWVQKYTSEQREMISRLLSYGHSMQSIRNLEKAYPGELHLKVCLGLMATREGQGELQRLTQQLAEPRRNESTEKLIDAVVTAGSSKTTK